MLNDKPCDLCGTAAASLVIKRNLAGMEQQTAICAGCAAEQGIRVTAAVLPCLPADLLDTLLELPGSRPADQGICAACGTLFKEIRTTGLAGCVHCFDEFQIEIGHLLPRVARRTTHTGSIPQSLHRFRRLFADKADLTARMQSALRSEDFEAAAGIRDLLRDLGDGSPEA